MCTSMRYDHIDPPVIPPNDGCILIARLYKKDGQLRVYDSAPSCVEGATNLGPDDPNGIFKYHALSGVLKSDIIWAAYGWVFPKEGDADNAWTSNIGCVWPNANVSSPW